jgi:hypothetical protein
MLNPDEFKLTINGQPHTVRIIDAERTEPSMTSPVPHMEYEYELLDQDGHEVDVQGWLHAYVLAAIRDHDESCRQEAMAIHCED